MITAWGSSPALTRGAPTRTRANGELMISPDLVGRSIREPNADPVLRFCPVLPTGESRRREIALAWAA